MWPVEHFAVAGPPTGVGNMLRCFHWLKPSRRPSLLLVHPVPCVRITAGVGTLGSLTTPGGDHRSSVSLSQVFPLFSPPASIRRNGPTERFFEKMSRPSEWIMRAKLICLLTTTSLYSMIACLECAWKCLFIKDTIHATNDRLEPLHLIGQLV